jgi:hypothetical protein
VRCRGAVEMIPAFVFLTIAGLTFLALYQSKDKAQ